MPMIWRWVVSAVCAAGACCSSTTAAAAVAAPASAPFPYLPPLLQFDNGTAVTTAAQWEGGRRAEIKALLGKYLLGTAPDRNPALLNATELNSTTAGVPGGGTSKFFHLEFERGIAFEIEVLVPPTPLAPARTGAAGEEAVAPAFPVFLTQWNHREWALLGVGRGYVGVVYPGADTRDAAPQFQAAYAPDHFTMALIRARAMVASSSLDFVLAPPGGPETFGPHPLDAARVCVTGHSRNGKQSLIFAAFDDRVAAVVGSSPGAPISSPYHFSSHNFYGEGPDAGQAGHWWVEGILNYSAHPERLPMDGHGVLGLIVPRPCAVGVGWTDKEGSLTFAAEMNVLEAAGVHRALYGDDSARKLRIIHRPGAHHGFDDVNSYFDWFDTAFGRLNTAAFPLGWAGPSMLTEADPSLHMITPAAFNWTTWAAATGPPPPAPAPAAPLEERVRWLLQLDNASEASIPSMGSSYNEMQEPEFLYTAEMMNRVPKATGGGSTPAPDFQTFSFGDYVTGIAYWTPDSNNTTTAPAKVTATMEGAERTTDAPLRPAVIWLHPYSYNTGFTPTYGSDGVHLALARAGFVSMAFDQVGCGLRILEGGTAFYARRGGRASLFGHMVRDARAAVDVLECLGGPDARAAPQCNTGETPGSTYPAQSALRNIPGIDPSRIFLAGYSLGGAVALHAAALDARVAGVGAFAAFTPMRTDSNDRPTLGLRRLYDLHAALPRLGFYAADPSAVPYDYDELIGALAPRPVLLHTPQDDRDATFADVAACAKDLANVWARHGAAGNFTHNAPAGETVMGVAESHALVEWLQGAAGLAAAK